MTLPSPARPPRPLIQVVVHLLIGHLKFFLCSPSPTALWTPPCSLFQHDVFLWLTINGARIHRCLLLTGSRGEDGRGGGHSAGSNGEPRAWFFLLCGKQTGCSSGPSYIGYFPGGFLVSVNWNSIPSNAKIGVLLLKPPCYTKNYKSSVEVENLLVDFQKEKVSASGVTYYSDTIVDCCCPAIVPLRPTQTTKFNCGPRFREVGV